MIHMYIGNGKGKTTAAAGLAIRAAGHGFRVIFAQFLKTSETGELASFKTLDILVIRSQEKLGWTFNMDEKIRELCRKEQGYILDRTAGAHAEIPASLIVLDEALDALNAGLLDDMALQTFVETTQQSAELVFTGRSPPLWLKEKADYISDIQKIKHPYDRGITARDGIEK